ncbi:MAG: NAD-dependent epimerase/dehydratase family protein [Rhabdochlamydiaceae bacterium]|jgi:UDP-glucuronate 4-epimerase
MRIFITGIAGFIGYHLAMALSERGETVVGCDNFNSYYDPKLKRARAKHLAQLGIQVFEGDITDAVFLEKQVVDLDITHVVNLAAQAGVRYSMVNPKSYVHSNLDGFVSVLEVVRRYPHIKVIYASSSSVYGLNQKIPFSEIDSTDHPANLYAATKKADELMAFAYHQVYGISVTGLRYFTVYGPWGRPDMAYFSFTKAIWEGTPLEIYNQGNMERDFTYIDDVVRGTIAAIELGSACEIFNLGNNHPESVLTLISLIEKYTGKKAIRKLLPLQLGEVPITYADISKSNKELNFWPTMSLEEGMEKFVEWYLKNR